jgi:AraC-like DNA-binding protein
LVSGDLTLTYSDRVVHISEPVLFFVNPKVPHAVLRRSAPTTGYACLFTESFFTGRERTELLKYSPLFQTADSPRIMLNGEQVTFMTGIFQKMLAVYSGDYPYKADLVRTYIELILHEAQRIQPTQNNFQVNGTARIAHLFMDLLERQFPIERSNDPLKLRTPQEFAECLSIHVNYLNRSVKQATGKPTSVHIADRVVAEAKALLQHSDWSVAEIAYALGFAYPTYFNNYFKRITGQAPKSFRV